MGTTLYPPNRACNRCGVRDITVIQRALPGLKLRLCRPCWNELQELIRVWMQASLRELLM